MILVTCFSGHCLVSGQGKAAPWLMKNLDAQTDLARSFSNHCNMCTDFLLKHHLSWIAVIGVFSWESIQYSTIQLRHLVQKRVHLEVDSPLQELRSGGLGPSSTELVACFLPVTGPTIMFVWQGCPPSTCQATRWQSQQHRLQYKNSCWEEIPSQLQDVEPENCWSRTKTGCYQRLSTSSLWPAWTHTITYTN